METNRGNPVSGSDRDLVVAFKSGDKRAYDEIFRRHSPRVRVVCARRLGHSHDAEEAVQETFLRAFQALPRFNGQYKLGSWLNRIAINVCIDELRSRSRAEIVKAIEDGDLEAERGPDEIVGTRRPEVLAALHELKPLHADALKLQVVHGLSHEEVAQQLSISPAKVKALLHRARLAFKRVMNEASGFVLLPLAALRKGRKHGHAVPAGAGTINLMGLATVAHTSWPIAERVVTGAVVAALAIGSGSAAVSQERAKVELRSKKVANGKDLRNLQDIAPAQVGEASSSSHVEDEEGILSAVVEEKELSASVPIDDALAPVTERIEQELRKHTTKKRKEGDVQNPPSVDPETVRDEVEDRANKARDTAEGLLDNS